MSLIRNGPLSFTYLRVGGDWESVDWALLIGFSHFFDGLIIVDILDINLRLCTHPLHLKLDIELTCGYYLVWIINWTLCLSQNPSWLSLYLFKSILIFREAEARIIHALQIAHRGSLWFLKVIITVVVQLLEDWNVPFIGWFLLSCRSVLFHRQLFTLFITGG